MLNTKRVRHFAESTDGEILRMGNMAWRDSSQRGCYIRTLEGRVGANWDAGASSRRPPDTVELHIAGKQDSSGSDQSPLWDTIG